jgi:HSP20 family protein
MSEDLDRLTQDGWVPRIEIINRKDAVEVRAELPGVRPEDVNVQVSSGMLTISGERQQEEHEEREGFVRTEREYGAFSRMIPLPDGADENRVSAKFNNGMLQITVPVAAREKGKRVEVQS